MTSSLFAVASRCVSARHAARSFALALACGAAPLTTAGAQGENSGKGFLFGAPSGGITVRAGYAGANAGSDIFSFTTSELTLNRRDFSSVGWGADLDFSLTPRVALRFTGDFSGMAKRSEFREWVDNDGMPIEQSTTFGRTSLSAGLKWFLAPNGRELGRLAWVPPRYVPFVGVGVGRMWYEFKQEGDFIDFDDNNRVFYDKYVSTNWASTAHVVAGFDWSLNQRWALTTQTKYEWANAELSRDFTGFQRIDLSGFAATAGLHLRF